MPMMISLENYYSLPIIVNDDFDKLQLYCVKGEMIIELNGQILLKNFLTEIPYKLEIRKL